MLQICKDSVTLKLTRREDQDRGERGSWIDERGMTYLSFAPLQSLGHTKFFYCCISRTSFQ